MIEPQRLVGKRWVRCEKHQAQRFVVRGVRFTHLRDAQAFAFRNAARLRPNIPGMRWSDTEHGQRNAKVIARSL